MPMAATKGAYILIATDDHNAESPRETDDCFGAMTCFYSRCNLGDKHNHDAPHDFLRWLVDSEIPPEDVTTQVMAGKMDGLKFE